MRVSHQFIPPGHSGGLNMLPQHPMPNLYSHAAFPNPAPLRPPVGMFGSSDFPNISAADAYRQHHEVTAMVRDMSWDTLIVVTMLILLVSMNFVEVI